MFGRDRPSTGLPGLPGAGPSGGIGLPGASSAPAGADTSAGRRGTLNGAPSGPGPHRRPWTPGAGTVRVFVLLMIGAIAWLFVTDQQARLDDPVEQGRRGEITPTSAQSFLRGNRLQQAIDVIAAAAPGTTIVSLRITPTQVNATVHQRDGRQQSITVDPALELQQVSSGAAAGEGLAPDKIPVGVPNRLVSLAVDRLELRPEHLDYVLLSVFDVPNGPFIANWGLYYSEPPLDNDAVAALDGTDLRKMGTPDAAARAAQRKSDRAAAKARADAKRAIAAARKRMKEASR